MLAFYKIEDRTIPYGITNEFNQDLGKLEYAIEMNQYVLSVPKDIKRYYARDLIEILTKLKELNNA